jgi:16S rRNA (cytidine1402-2'-O)-methyltransferase
MLYIVATPIGNLEDISARALNILSEIDVIFCEDTRVTKKLLDRYKIETPTKSYHAQSSDAKEDYIIKLLKEGKSLALVVDAGTPTISDPGVKLVARVREELPEIQISPIPGPSAIMSALSVSGVSSAQFIFLGFFPHKKGRETLFTEIAESNRTIVFYESPHRIMKTLERLARILPKGRKVVIARELTKIHEQVVSGFPQEIFRYFIDNATKVRGEFVVIIGA